MDQLARGAQNPGAIESSALVSVGLFAALN